MADRTMRDLAGILHFLTPQQMAEEIVRLDGRLREARNALNAFVLAHHATITGPATEIEAKTMHYIALNDAIQLLGRPLHHHAEPSPQHGTPEQAQKGGGND